MRVAFVGDIALGDHPKTVGFGFRSRYNGGIPAELAARITPPGGAADLMLGNLEFSLADDARAVTVEERQCRGAREYAGFLAAAGVTALNVANNHSSQHGAAAFHTTVDALRAAGIHVTGTADDFTERGILRIGALRVALLSWSDRPRQYAAETPPYNELGDAAYAQIADAATRADLVIASVHWGDEFILVPSDRERAIARAMVNAGASAVIGHHPHVVREVERYGEGVIAYSLGNFIGDMTWDPRTRYSGWLTARIDGRAVRDELFTPAIIADDYFPRRLTPDEERAAGRERTAASARQREHVERAGYAAAAAAAHRRHVRRTALMMVRNIGRYAPGLPAKLFLGAIGNRLRRAPDAR